MAKAAALGDGPVAFFKDGVQIEVPLSAIHFQDNVVSTDRSDLAGFDKWIAFLASRGRLVAGVAPPIATALVATAVPPGTNGNSITLIVAPLDPAAIPAQADLTVTEKDLYEGLTLVSLSTQLGTRAAPGTRPGLLCVKPNPNATTTLPAPTPRITATTAAGVDPTWTIAGTPGTPGDAAANPVVPPTPSTEVILELRRPGTGSSLDARDFFVSITVQPATTGGPTFTLAVTWTKTVSVRVGDTLAGVASPLAPLGYFVKFATPEGTPTITRLPRPGTVTLTGGNERVEAVPATATVLANE
jgi:hypothetical protein